MHNLEIIPFWPLEAGVDHESDFKEDDVEIWRLETVDENCLLIS